MPYSPSVNDVSGQILAGGITSAINGIRNDFNDYQDKLTQKKAYQMILQSQQKKAAIGAAMGAPNAAFGIPDGSGGSQSGTGVDDTIDKMTSMVKKAKAYRGMAVDGMGMDPDDVSKMSFSDLKARMQAMAVQSAQSEQQARTQDLMSQIQQRTGQGNRQQALADQITGQNQNMGKYNQMVADAMQPTTAPAMTSGGMPAMGPPQQGAIPNLSPQQIQRMMASANLSPQQQDQTLKARQLMGADGAGAQPVNWKSEAGRNYVVYKNTITADKPITDMTDLPDAPSGYEWAPDGKGGAKTVRTPVKNLPDSFNKLMDGVGATIAQHQQTLDMSDTELSKLDPTTPPAAKRAAAQRKIALAQQQGKRAVDRYVTQGYITPDQQADHYDELGLPAPGGAAPAAAAPAAAATGKVKVINPQGKAGFIDAAQLQDALKKGYKKAQ